MLRSLRRPQVDRVSVDPRTARTLVELGLAEVYKGRLIPRMAGAAGPNTSPIFTLTPNIGGCKVTAANTNSDGTGNISTPTIFVAYTAGANGDFVTKLVWSPTATSAGTSTNATIGRAFMSSVTSGATTPGTNTWPIPFWEVTLPAVTADSSSAPTNSIVIPLNFALPAGWTILVTNHAAPASNSAWVATVIGGSY